MTDLDRPLRSPALYNPHLLSRDELLQLFQARQDLLDRLLDDLRSTPDGQPAQHHLIVGQRGMGKTMLLRRLQFAIEDDPQLREHWIPLTFPEEQYNVAHLSDFWLNCIDALSDRLERLPDAMPAIDLDRQVEALEDLPEAERASRALGVLLDAARTCERRFLLLVDNADLILERIDEQQWNLREVLSSQPLITFLGASAAVLETTYQYDKAFYDFFEIHQLSGLGPDETRDLLLNYARAQGVDEVRRIAEEEPGRLRTLHRLTGGNPRTLVLLFNILAQTSGGDIRTDLEQLLDHSTPLYKARFEALPAQAQQVVDALALHWDPVTAGDLTSGMRLEVNAVSSQLNRLVKAGLVEKVTYEPATRAGYQIAERFFNIWYLMRASRRVRRRLIWLVEFLRMFYGQEELANQARAHLRLVPRSASGERLRHAEYSFALAQASESKPLREALERGGLRMLTGHQDLRRELRELIDLDAAELEFRTRAEELERFEALKRKLHDHLQTDEPENRRELAKRLLRAPFGLAEKEALATRLDGQSSQERRALNEALAGFERRIINQAEAGLAVLQAVEQGLMMSLHDIAGAEDAEAVLEVQGVVATATAARAESAEPNGSLDRLEIALAGATSAYPWLVWLARKGSSAVPGQVDKAIERISALAGDDPELLTELGYLLWRTEFGGSSGKRLVDAERAYRRAVSADPKNITALNNLGFLLTEAGRTDEAEEAYRSALELEPADADLWYNLGRLLRTAGRIGEAEECFRRAVEADPNDSAAWNNLGTVLIDAGRFAEAEVALRGALKQDQHNATAWRNLGGLLNKTGRSQESEEAIRSARGLESENPTVWYRWASFREEVYKRSEWEAALRRALEVDPTNPSILIGYARLLFLSDGDLVEAELRAAAAAGIERADPDIHHTFACILVRNRKWAGAQDSARVFLRAWAEELPEGIWTDVITFFREAVVAGRAREAATLLDEVALGERWRPLREALESLAQENPNYLRRVAPEVREAAEVIVSQLVEKAA